MNVGGSALNGYDRPQAAGEESIFIADIP